MPFFNAHFSDKQRDERVTEGLYSSNSPIVTLLTCSLKKKNQFPQQPFVFLGSNTLCASVYSRSYMIYPFQSYIDIYSLWIYLKKTDRELFCYLIWLGRYRHSNQKDQLNFAIFLIFSLKSAIISLKMWLLKKSHVNFLQMFSCL